MISMLGRLVHKQVMSSVTFLFGFELNFWTAQIFMVRYLGTSSKIMKNYNMYILGIESKAAGSVCLFNNNDILS